MFLNIGNECNLLHKKASVKQNSSSRACWGWHFTFKSTLPRLIMSILMYIGASVLGKVMCWSSAISLVPPQKLRRALSHPPTSLRMGPHYSSLWLPSGMVFFLVVPVLWSSCIPVLMKSSSTCREPNDRPFWTYPSNAKSKWNPWDGK